MNEIQNIHGKLLYLTQSLFQRSRITLPQKDFLKMKIISKDLKIFQFYDQYLSNKNIHDLEDSLILYSLPPIREKSASALARPQSPPHQEVESNKAKKQEDEGESDSDDELNEEEEKELIAQGKKNRAKSTRSDEIDFRRASFTDYYKFVKKDLYQHPSADELELENRMITEVKTQMEMSKIDSNRNTSPKNETPNSNNMQEMSNAREGDNKIHEGSKFRNKIGQ